VSNNAGPKFDRDKVEIIHNWEDESYIQPKDKENNWFSEEHDLVDSFTLFYSGNIAHFHDLETVVRAAARWENDDVQVLIIGEGDNKENIVDLAEELDLRGDTVRFLPYQPFEDLPYSLTSGDVSLVTVKEGFEGVCVSSKLYTALAAGQPVLAVSQPYDDEARIVEKFDAGINVPQGDVEGVVEAVNRWTENPNLVERQGKNAREAFENNFTKSQSIDEYYELLAG
jgi:glycosyltransferase involved in cell wall biosynthesis